jgi:hypothetical protein
LEGLLAETDHPFIRRRAQAVLLYDTDLTAVDMAAALWVDPRTAYPDLQAYDQAGLACLQPPVPGGVVHAYKWNDSPRFGACLAETPPLELGLPYGRWTLRRMYLRQRGLSKRSAGSTCTACSKKGAALSADQAQGRQRRSTATRHPEPPAEHLASFTPAGRLLVFQCPVYFGQSLWWLLDTNAAVGLTITAEDAGFFYLFSCYDTAAGKCYWACFPGKVATSVCHFIRRVRR